MYTTTDFRKNLKIEIDGEPFIIVDFQHVKPGKGGAFVRNKIRGLKTGLVIDRTFVDTDGVRWIVDFKTSDHRGGGIDTFLDREQARYREQLERYGYVMARLDPRPQRLALYFPLAGGWREWEPGV